MLPSNPLVNRVRGIQIVPSRLEASEQNLEIARDIIDIFETCKGRKRKILDEHLSLLEGEETDYRVKRGLAHLLQTDACTFETRSPLEPEVLR